MATHSDHFPLSVLSTREQQVLLMQALGYSRRRVAARLRVSNSRIEDCVHKLLDKLGKARLRDVIDHLLYALDRGALRSTLALFAWDAADRTDLTIRCLRLEAEVAQLRRMLSIVNGDEHG